MANIDDVRDASEQFAKRKNNQDTFDGATDDSILNTMVLEEYEPTEGR